MIHTLVFDWGDTLMRDFNHPGPMSGWPEVAWIEGAEAFLKQVSQRYRCVIATSAEHSDVAEMKAALQRVDAVRYFDFFFSRFELQASKPDPLFFERVLQLSGSLPSQTMMIGNLYEKDITGAKAVGMKTVLFNWQYAVGPFPAADFIIYSFDELYDILI